MPSRRKQATAAKWKTAWLHRDGTSSHKTKERKETKRKFLKRRFATLQYRAQYVLQPIFCADILPYL